MAEPIFMRHSLGALRAVDAAGEEVMAAVPQNEVVKVTITRPRNVQHHRKFFALLNAVFPHQDTYPTQRAFRAAVTVALGHADSIKLPDGRVILLPQSIAFSKMDQSEFEKFYDRVVKLITERILPNVDRRDLDREVEDILRGYNG